MERKRPYLLLSAAIGTALLILDSKTAVESARLGIDLCLHTVIPSLFPFFVLSTLLTNSLLGSSISFLRPITALCRIPPGSESILVTGFLGGYPVGAQCVATAFRSGQLNRTDARRMLGFCSNAGPAFLFGMVGGIFPYRWIPWLLWLIHVISAILTAVILPGGTETRINVRPVKPVTLTTALRTSLSVMASVCGWVVLFRIVIGFLNRWILWILPDWGQAAVSGLLELSNGCCNLISVDNIGLRFLLCSGMLAFGGLCVTMQTISVTTGLALNQYLAGKLMQTALSLVMSCAAMWLLPADARCTYHLPILTSSFCFALIFALFLRKKEKKDSIPVASIV